MTDENDPATAAEIVRRFGRELGDLRERHGRPSFAEMDRRVQHIAGAAGSRNTFHQMVTAPKRVYEPAYVRGFVLALELTEADAADWEIRRQAALESLQRSRVDPGPRRRPRWRWVVPAAAVAVVAAVVLVVSLLPGTKDVATAADGTDPKVTGCATGAVTADTVDAYFPAEHLVGVVELRMSARCGTAWARLTPTVGLPTSPPVTLELDVRRPADDGKALFHVVHDGQPAYGNMLRADHECVYAVVTLSRGGTTSPAFATQCHRI